LIKKKGKEKGALPKKPGTLTEMFLHTWMTRTFFSGVQFRLENVWLKVTHVRVARFFLARHTKTRKIYQIAVNIPNVHKNTK
jgi:hypothetical protein